MKKGATLLKIVVMGALALLVLVIVGAFFLVGSYSEVQKFGQAQTKQQASNDEATIYTSCLNICNNAKSMAMQISEMAACRSYRDGWVKIDCFESFGSCDIDTDGRDNCDFNQNTFNYECGAGEILCQ